MKQKSIFRILGFMAYIAAIGMVIGCPQTKPKQSSNSTSGEKAFTVKFSTEDMECKRDAKVLNNGDSVKEGQILVFTAREPEAVNNWKVKNEARSSNVTFDYTVDSQDANNNIIEVSLEKYSQMQIKFGSDISCKKADKPFNSGEKAYENVELVFTANINSGKTVDVWTFGNTNQNGINGPEYRYTVNKEDADAQNVINVSYTERAIEQVKVIFDAALIECKKAADNTPVNPNTSLDENTKLKFGKKNSALEITGWKVNDRVFPVAGDFEYTLNLTDAIDNAGEKTVTISYTENPQFKVLYDASKISCIKTGSDTVNNGSYVDLNTSLEFKVIKIGENKKFIHWILNNKDITEATTASYTVIATNENAAENGGINCISVDFKEEDLLKAQIKFNSGELICEYMKKDLSYENIDEDSFVYENKEIILTPKISDPSKTVDKWVINDAEDVGVPKKVMKGVKENSFSFVPKAADFIENSGNMELKISYTLIDKVKIELEFDSSRVEVKNGTDNVNNKDSVPEGTELELIAKPESNKTITNWTFNGTIQTSMFSKTQKYKIKKDDAIKQSDGKYVLTVSFNTRESEQIKLTFPTSSAPNKNGGYITCVKKEGNVPVTSETVLTEGTELIFTANPSSPTKTLASWYINETHEVANEKKEKFTYTLARRTEGVGVDKIEGGQRVQHIDFTEKPILIEILFDDDKIEGPLNYKSGFPVASGNTVILYAKDIEGKTVDKWSLNGKELEASDGKFEIKIENFRHDNPDHAVFDNENNKYVARFDYTTKDAEQATLKFNESDMTVMSSNNTPLTNGASVSVGVLYRFTATLNADEIVDEWHINGNIVNGSDGKPFKQAVLPLRIHDSYLVDNAGTKEITVSVTKKIGAEKMIIQFKEPIKCKKGAEEIVSGYEAKENEIFELEVPFDHPPKNSGVWYFSGRPEPHNKGLIKFRHKYTVNTSDAKDNGSGEKIITIEYKEAVKRKVKFNKTDFTCMLLNGTEIESEVTEVSDLNFIYLIPKNMAADKSIKTWTIGSTEIPEGNALNFLKILVAANDASENLIDYSNISFTEKDAVMFTIDFDDTKIQCTDVFGKTVIAKNTQIKENSLYLLSSTDNKPYTWEVDGVGKGSNKKGIYYIPKSADDADNNGTIVITCK